MSRHRAAQFRSALRSHALPAGDDDVRRVHRLDGEFRALLLRGLERTEIALRGRVDSLVADQHGATWHVEPRSFRSDVDHAALLSHCAHALDRSHDPAVLERWACRDLTEVPFGMLAEELPLGTLSRLTGALTPRLQRSVAATFRLPAPTLRATLQHITHVRNCCAHHTRLWGRTLGVPTPRYRSPADLADRLAGAPLRSPYRSAVLIAHLGSHSDAPDELQAATDLLAAHDDLRPGFVDPIVGRRL